MTDFLQALPKIELHVHLEGSLRAGTIERLAQRNGIDVGDRAYLERQYQFDGFQEFLHLFMLGLDVIRTGDDIADATDALAQELAAQNVRYAEVTTTAYSHFTRGIPVDAYVEGLNEGRQRARARNVELAWVIDIPREFEPPDSTFTADLLTGADAPAGAVAIGLGGPEYGSDPRKYADAFARAKAHGLASVPHAGEMDGPQSVIGALDTLHADRIGHGIRAIEDDALVQRLVDNGIPLEVSLTSNILLGATPSYADHPIRALLDHGVRCTLNTDDPAYFSTTLVDELHIARDLLQLNDDALRDFQHTAVDVSFASPARKRELHQEIASSIARAT